MKDLYKQHYYGVYYRYKFEFFGVNLFKSKEEIKTNPSFENTLLEVEVLKDFNGKRNVLCIIFEDGTKEYETLYEPGYFFDTDTGIWQETTYREIPNKFIQLFNE